MCLRCVPLGVGVRLRLRRGWRGGTGEGFPALFLIVVSPPATLRGIGAGEGLWAPDMAGRRELYGEAWRTAAIPVGAAVAPSSRRRAPSLPVACGGRGHPITSSAFPPVFSPPSTA